MKGSSEHVIQHEIMAALGCRPDLRIWRQNTGALKVDDRFIRFGLRGSSDILGIIAPTGRLLAIEVKAARGVLTDYQRAFGAMVEKFGGLYVVARSSTEAVTAVDAAIAGARR